MCEANVYFYMEEKIKLHNVIVLRGLDLPCQSPHRELVMEWDDVSIILNRNLEKACDNTWTSCWRRLKKQELFFVHCSGQQLGASSHLAQW